MFQEGARLGGGGGGGHGEQECGTIEMVRLRIQHHGQRLTSKFRKSLKVFP